MHINSKMAIILIRKVCSQILNEIRVITPLLRDSTSLSTQPNYIFFNSGFEDNNEKIQIMTDMKVYENFITETEENSLLQELEPHLKRKRYERDHWDNAIKEYRETEKMKWDPTNLEIIDRVKKIAFKENSVPLKYVHVLDLRENGLIMPHIDSTLHCGTTIAGISLLSDSVMRLVHDKEKSKIVDIFLKRRSLYIMTGSARYSYTHEILGNENSKFNGQTVKKSRRISIICRNEP